MSRCLIIIDIVKIVKYWRCSLLIIMVFSCGRKVNDSSLSSVNANLPASAFDERFAAAGKTLPGLPWNYVWDNSYTQDQSLDGQTSFAYVVGKLDNRKLVLLPERPLNNPEFVPSQKMSGWSHQSAANGFSSWKYISGNKGSVLVTHRVDLAKPDYGWGTQVVQTLTQAIVPNQYICATVEAKSSNAEMYLILQQTNDGFHKYHHLNGSVVRIPADGKSKRASTCALPFEDTKTVQIVLRNMAKDTTAEFSAVGTNPQFGDVCDNGGRLQCIQTIYNSEISYIQQRLSQLRNLGSVWIVANEVDLAPAIVSGNENAYENGRQHGIQFKRYRDLIKARDPSALLANAGLLNSQAAISNGWLDGFLSILSLNERPDIWNIHAYAWGNQAKKSLDDVRGFRDRLNNIGEGGKPLWITEFGTLSNAEQAPQQVVEKLMSDVTLGLASQGLAQKWFWFYSGSCIEKSNPDSWWKSTGYSKAICLWNDDGKLPSKTADTYFALSKNLNLIKNGSFEWKGLTRASAHYKPSWESTVMPNNWSFWTSKQGMAQGIQSISFDDRASVKIVHQEGPWGTQVSQSVGAVSRGKRYAVSAWARSASQADVQLIFQRTNGGIYTELANQAARVGTNWKRIYFEIEIKTHDISTAQVVLRSITANTEVFFDSVSVVTLVP